MIILILVLIIFIAPFVINKVQEKETREKYFKWYIFFFLGFLFVVMFFQGPLEKLNNKLSFKNIFGISLSEKETVVDGFTIEGYETVINVELDNKVYVTENIDVNFYGSNKHGIYRFIPYWLEYTGMDNKTIKRRSNILNLRAVDENYTLDKVNKKARIKIGDKDLIVYGDHSYQIKYTYDMGKDPFEGFDEFIFNAFGDYWGTQIKKPKIVINMPKKISNSTINFYTDRYRKNNINDLIDYSIDGETITIKGKDNLRLNGSLVVDIGLPEGYFVGGSYTYGFGSFFLSMLILGITGYIIYMWSKYGKDYEKRVPTVEFYPPDNLNSAEIGYIYNRRKTSKKLTISLIIQLASKGYIRIDEEKGKRKKDDKIKITKLLVKPKEVKKLNDCVLEKRRIIVKKMRDVDHNLNEKETSVMKYLFKDNYIVSLGENIDLFLDVKDNLVKNGYVEIISDNTKDIEKKNEKIKEDYAKLVEEYNTCYENYTKEMDEYNKKRASLEPKTAMENIVYSKLFEAGNEVILSEHKSFYTAFSDINNNLESVFKKKVYDLDAKSKKVKARILNLIVIILNIISFLVIEDLDPKLSFIYYVSFGCILVNIFFTIIMGRKTDYGEIITARVKGFREFLVTAEKEKLEALVEKNPHYFYDILPYTYVLNVSKKWIKKFEDIPMPEVNMGNVDYTNGDFIFTSIGNNVYYPVSSSGSSGGCSSCGGGCSSCGGGCSSCGGGGSW